MPRAAGIVYWDTSAVISALFRDRHSAEAAAVAREPATHLVSSLGWAESHAVVARLERERALTDALIAAARETLTNGPWSRVSLDPATKQIARLARSWPLRGAGLWHLAAAKELQMDLPELRFLTFDNRLAAAARGEGLNR